MLRIRERAWTGTLSVVLLAGVAGMPISAVASGGGSGGSGGSGGNGGTATEQLKDELRAMVQSARDKVFPALVNISVVTTSFEGGEESKGGATGSGTIISKEGHILTNQHVVNDGKKFKVTLADRTIVPARLIGEDPLTDLAILQIDVKDLPPGTKLAVAEFGDSDKLAIGDTVMAMGSPFALSRSVTLGIVSNTERVFTSGFLREEFEEMQGEAGTTGTFTRWIQHDAAINPGNSGGPLVNLEGKVVGVNTLGGSNMGFASPGNLARQVADAIIRDNEVIRSWIGASFKNIRDTGFDNGVLINSVIDDSPAYEAGLRAGDRIVEIDGNPITIRFVEEVPPLIKSFADRPVGSQVKVAYVRNGEKKEATVTTKKLLRERGDRAALRLWGVTIAEITEKLAEDLHLTNRDGVFVTGVKGGSPGELAEPSLMGGDIIKTIGGKQVKTVHDAIEAYKSVMSPEKKEGESSAETAAKIPEFLLIEFDRKGKSQATLIKPRPEKKEDPPRELAKAWLGVATQPVLRDLAREMGHEGQTGYRITRIYPGTLAEKSGLKVGDVIIAIDSDKTSVKGMQDAGALQRKIRTLKVDGEVNVKVLRRGSDGKVAPEDIKVTLERTRLSPEESRRDSNKDFEVTVRELTFFDRDDNRWEETVQGVIVAGAEPLGWAGAAGVRSGDLIQRISVPSDATGAEKWSEVITDLDSYRKVMERLAKEQPARVTMGILRDNRALYRYLEPEWKPTVQSDGSKESPAK
ncbi:MAG: trypsin-like peptidase domain-containing protein [Phycisphaerales bacterium]|nr:trypsin-like peptidase domain-containing protein [Planctomycetota bacterium]